MYQCRINFVQTLVFYSVNYQSRLDTGWTLYIYCRKITFSTIGRVSWFLFGVLRRKRCRLRCSLGHPVPRYNSSMSVYQHADVYRLLFGSWKFNFQISYLCKNVWKIFTKHFSVLGNEFNQRFRNSDFSLKPLTSKQNIFN